MNNIKQSVLYLLVIITGIPFILIIGLCLIILRRQQKKNPFGG